MPKAYWITAYREIKDPAKLAAYAKLAPLALAPYGVRYLCRGNPNATFEAGLKERLVSPNFPASKRRSPGTTARAMRKRCARSATAPCAMSGSSKALSDARHYRRAKGASAVFAPEVPSLSFRGAP